MEEVLQTSISTIKGSADARNISMGMCLLCSPFLSSPLLYCIVLYCIVLYCLILSCLSHPVLNLFLVSILSFFIPHFLFSFLPFFLSLVVLQLLHTFLYQSDHQLIGFFLLRFNITTCPSFSFISNVIHSSNLSHLYFLSSLVPSPLVLVLCHSSLPSISFHL
jgi:hypothetical protein